MKRLLPLIALAAALALGAEAPARLSAGPLAASAQGAGGDMQRQLERQAERQAQRQAERQAQRQAERQAQRQAERQAQRQAERQAQREAEQQAQRQAERKAARQAERQAARQAERQAARQAERQAERQAARQAEREAARQASDRREERDRDREGRRDRDRDGDRGRDWDRDRHADRDGRRDGDRRWDRPRHGFERYKVVDRRPRDWRPRDHRPPRWRAPHPYWGRYHYSPFWGWYFAAPLAYTTLVYVDERPSGPTCEDVYADGGRLILCDGALYRPVTYRERTVYEIVSADPEEDPGYGAETGAEIGAPPARALRLATPFQRGEDVARLQRELRALGYLRSAPDGVFGPQTASAVRAFQRDQGLPADGVVERETAFRLGI